MWYTRNPKDKWMERKTKRRRKRSKKSGREERQASIYERNFGSKYSAVKLQFTFGFFCIDLPSSFSTILPDLYSQFSIHLIAITWYHPLLLFFFNFIDLCKLGSYSKLGTHSNSHSSSSSQRFDQLMQRNRLFTVS